MPTFEEAFTQGFQNTFQRTFKTPNEMEAEEKALKVKDLDIQKKEIELNMQKTKHQHELGVKEIAGSGFDPNVVARVMSDRFPNKHQYKFDSEAFKNSNGTEYRFSVGQYEKNEDGTYKRDPISGERVFTPYEGESSVIGVAGESPEEARENFMLEVNRRVNPMAWMANDLEKLMTVFKTQQELQAGKEIAETKADLTGKEQRKREGFQASESEKDRASREKIAEMEQEGRVKAAKFQAGQKAKTGAATFRVNGKDVTLTKDRYDAIKNKQPAYSESLGGIKVSAQDVFIIDQVKESQQMKKVIQQVASGREGAEDSLRSTLLNAGMTDTVVEEFITKIDVLAEEAGDSKGLFSSIAKLFK